MQDNTTAIKNISKIIIDLIEFDKNFDQTSFWGKISSALHSSGITGVNGYLLSRNNIYFMLSTYIGMYQEEFLIFGVSVDKSGNIFYKDNDLDNFLVGK